MKHFKFILPAMVFVMAIGMSFASIGLEEVQSDQYLGAPSCPELVDAVCDGSGSQDCQVQSASLGGPYSVYDNPTCEGDALKHSENVIIFIP